ncbi:ABC transporter [Coprinopsis sp. MPI-PUGE-AT-0042]|nr:ABC transporter [Coprinopsis sp. MPI-PUGE-AT-0042]
MQPLLWTLTLLATCAYAQTCQNYGISNGNDCSCPTGFGGPECSELACHGTLFEGAEREYTSTSSGFANLTAAGCGCEDGWGGTACNVCQTSNACQSAFSAVNGSSSIGDSLTDAQNGTMVCNSAPRVYAASQMSCNVVNPTLQAIFPLMSTLNIERTLNPDLSPLPGSSSFGSAGSVFAQLFYNGVEQFYCQANSCTQSVSNSSTSFNCQNLECTCRRDTDFCGGNPAANITATINGLGGTLDIECREEGGKQLCNFVQSTLQNVFGASGLGLDGCTFGECVRQSVIDTTAGTTNDSEEVPQKKPLSGGVIAGLAVIGGLVGLALLFLLWGCLSQRKARRTGVAESRSRVGVSWSNLSYCVPAPRGVLGALQKRKVAQDGDKFILDNISGNVPSGQMMAILGPSGAGKTTLIEILAGKGKGGIISGNVSFPFESADGHTAPRIGFVPQQDILPPTLTVYETFLFAARLRLSESVSDLDKKARVDELLEKLGINHVRDTRIGDVSGGKARGISGGEMRRVTIGLELISSPDVLLLDEPTSGLDSVSAARIANVLHAIAHDPVNPIPVIASIHQPSSLLYQKFDSILLLAHGRALYSGPGGFGPVQHFSRVAPETEMTYKEGYNVAEYLLEVASEPPVHLFTSANDTEKLAASESSANGTVNGQAATHGEASGSVAKKRGSDVYATTFLTQLQYLCGREWKVLKRDKTLFWTHVGVSTLLGVFCGGLYYNTDVTIAGFQSRVGCLFFLGALLAFSSLSALYNIVEIRPLFLRERSGAYYSPTAWLLSRFFFDMIPLRLIPTIVVSTMWVITYWMAGLAPDAPHFFKFLFILVLYSLAMTLFNFLLGTLFQNGGVAILLSALSALYQMTFAGFFVNLNDIPPVLRWLQWLAPLKYTLEALSVNEVDSGLQIKDTLEGVPVNVSAALIMQLLFGFGLNNYYRDVLILFGYIAGFGISVIGVVWFFVRERR